MRGVKLVLCVDDDVAIAALVAEVVRFCKLEAEVHSDPIAAAARLRDPRIGAVLTDLMMPRLDGVELLSIAQEQRPDVRRVLITAAPNEEVVKEAVRAGVVQMVIAKPPGISDIKLALAWLG